MRLYNKLTRVFRKGITPSPISFNHFYTFNPFKHQTYHLQVNSAYAPQIPFDTSSILDICNKSKIIRDSRIIQDKIYGKSQEFGIGYGEGIFGPKIYIAPHGNQVDFEFLNHIYTNSGKDIPKIINDESENKLWDNYYAEGGIITTGHDIKPPQQYIAFIPNINNHQMYYYYNGLDFMKGDICDQYLQSMNEIYEGFKKDYLKIVSSKGIVCSNFVFSLTFDDNFKIFKSSLCALRIPLAAYKNSRFSDIITDSYIEKNKPEYVNVTYKKTYPQNLPLSKYEFSINYLVKDFNF